MRTLVPATGVGYLFENAVEVVNECDSEVVLTAKGPAVDCRPFRFPAAAGYGIFRDSVAFPGSCRVAAS
jgi:hypothetical protein